MTSRPARRARVGLYAARGLLVIGSVTLLALAAEWATARFAPSSPLLLLPRDDNCLRRDSLLGLALRPNCTGNLSGTPMRTNSLGMRGPEPRGNGARRVLVLGDSCTMGWRVAEDESYPAVLQSLLAARPGEPPVDVLNAGLAGYTSHQGVVTLRERGAALAPDVVVIAFGWNDATRLGDVVEQIETENRLRHLIRLDDWLLTHSHFYRWARWRGHERAPDASRPFRVSREHLRANLAEMIRLARQGGAQVVLVNFLRPANVIGHSPAIEAAAADHQVPMIVYEGERLDVVHPTAAGYRWLAGELAATLDAHQLLAPRANHRP